MKRESWWVVSSPRWGFLPYTSHTERDGAIERCVCGIMNFGKPFDPKEWQRLYRLGYRCVKIQAVPAKRKPK